MIEENKTCLGAMIYSFFGGVMLGAGLALLFAPMSGRETRSAIAHEFDELKEKLIKLEEKIHKTDDSDAGFDTSEEDFI